MKKIGILFRLIFFITTISFLLTACPAPQNYPVEPEITFKNITLSDSVDLLGNQVKQFKLGFHVVDGDGDIGYNDYDTTGVFGKDSEYYYNLFSKLFEVKNGETIEVVEAAPRNYRIPYVQPLGQNTTLIADIFINMDFVYNSSDELPYDSVMFEFYIYDRTLHKSNVEQSIVVKLTENGIFPPDTIN
jgi:hypothetical protein